MPQTHCLAGLKAARTKAKLEPEALADRLGVSVRTYYRWESGERLISFDKVCVLADTIGVSTDELRRDPDDGTVAAALTDWTVDA